MAEEVGAFEIEVATVHHDVETSAELISNLP